ncbi:hypothetical protein TVAG_319730 [Trichomonas vaginalis G3]|uniref:Uncharacterized protein n=1 Tax=Trichomonas vaginalis (strain ATCC PRA-98 / G3) TaxID=412133 RepID=A2DQC1_TRIV3|nr:hypothetical protein TVAGG3_1009560 [Trichomonas vaginalis G3]EAY17378.1 hypothetical protein TVAG_319730 [Trichomonas vaginalis G3]KAI5491388.1 hypothetical protein TVAGG3_1009560 [Trichomonas vaginalis G3]|eukprot:XP_001330747.1 hypothetical protein [Trichomonas vaginalis G3]
MWESGDLVEVDRIYIKVRYEGDSAECDKCFVSTSQTAATYLQAITQKFKKIGNVIVEEYVLQNIVEYARGGEPDLGPDPEILKKTLFPVYRHENNVFINFETNPLSPAECSDLIFDIAKPKELIILSTIHRSYFIPEPIEPNVVYTISSDSAKTTFPAPNTVGGFSASLLTKSITLNVNYNFQAVIEDDSGPTPKTFEAFNKIYPELNVEKIDLPQKAFDIYELKINDHGLIFT